MGNSMQKPLKTKSEYIMEDLNDKLTSSFENNKKVVKSLGLPLSKKVVNKISGYIVRVKKKEAQEN